MKNKNNFLLFSYLDEIEVDEFYRLKRFIHSDYFNTNERFKKLFDAIWEAKTRQMAYSDLNPGSIYQDTFPKQEASAMNSDFSGILKLVRRFIAQEEYNNDQRTRTRCLLKGLESRKAHRKFQLSINKEARLYENDGSPNRMEYVENYLQDLLIAEQKYKYHNIHENRKPTTNQLLQEFSDSIDRFHAILKAIYLGVMQQRTVLLGHQFRLGNVVAIGEVVQNSPPEQFPLLHMYYHLHLLWKKESIEQFDICNTILSKYRKRFSLYEQRQFFQILINYCRKVNDRQPQLWNMRQLDLYEQLFENELCYTGNDDRKKQISLHHFKNYMQLLVELDYFERFDTLQKRYAPKVYFKNEAQRLFVHQYNTTALYFAQYLYYRKTKRTIGEEFAYDTALRHIQNMEQGIVLGQQEFPDIFYRILYEVLLLKIYYEETRGFIRRRSAFHKYVNQTKISPVYRQAYLNFSTAILKLYRSKHQGLVYVKDDMDEMKIIEREWLLARVEELG